MQQTTVIGLFETPEQARTVRDDLIQAGFSHSEVSISDDQTGATGGQAAQEEPGFWDQIKEWLGMEEASYYEEGARRGGTVVTVTADAQRAQAAVDVIERHRPVDIDVQARQWQQEGWTGPPREQRPEAERRPEAKGAEGEERLELPEEELRVGKRRVQRGGVRIYTHVTEKPVEEQIELTEEHVDVERRPADRPADEDAFKERTIEATESHEEPVVKKEARVKEELAINKEEEKHTETVRDTVRKTEAEIEGQGRNESDDAYRFGREIASEDRFRGQPFDAIEGEAHQLFESRGLRDWQHNRDAVRQAYERSRAA